MARPQAPKNISRGSKIVKAPSKLSTHLNPSMFVTYKHTVIDGVAYLITKAYGCGSFGLYTNHEPSYGFDKLREKIENKEYKWFSEQNVLFNNRVTWYARKLKARRVDVETAVWDDLNLEKFEIDLGEFLLMVDPNQS